MRHDNVNKLSNACVLELLKDGDLSEDSFGVMLIVENSRHPLNGNSLACCELDSHRNLSIAASANQCFQLVQWSTIPVCKVVLFENDHFFPGTRLLCVDLLAFVHHKV